MQRTYTWLTVLSLLLLLGACEVRPKDPSTVALTQRQPDVPHLFIIGGGKRPPELIARLVEEAGLREGGYGLILPMSSAEPDSAIYYGLRQFEAQGLRNVIGMHFVAGQEPTAARLDSLRQATMIYITGGDQNRFMATARQFGIAEAIYHAAQQGCLIAGTSAGAAVMSEVMITGDERKHPEYSSTFRHIEADNIVFDEGLGLLRTAIVDQHFVKRSRYNRLISAVIERPELLGIGIDESTALLLHGNQAEVLGTSQVLLFTSSGAQTESATGLLGTRQLQLDVYLPGDQFVLTK